MKFEKMLQKLEHIERLLSFQKAVFTVAEAAAYTGKSKSAIYKLTSSRGIPCSKQGKHLYFDRLELEDWLKRNKIKSNDELEMEARSYCLKNR